MYRLIDNQGALNDRVFKTIKEVGGYLRNFHSADISNIDTVDFQTLLDIGGWTLEIIKDLSKEQIIKRLEQIIEGIEGDRFTIENINQLIKDIQ